MPLPPGQAAQNRGGETKISAEVYDEVVAAVLAEVARSPKGVRLADLGQAVYRAVPRAKALMQGTYKWRHITAIHDGLELRQTKGTHWTLHARDASALKAPPAGGGGGGGDNDDEDNNGSAAAAGGDGDPLVCPNCPYGKQREPRGQGRPHRPRCVQCRNDRKRERRAAEQASAAGSSVPSGGGGGGPLVKLELNVPNAMHRFLVGSSGSILKQIQNETGAKVYFPATYKIPAGLKPSHEDAIVVHGPQQAVDACCARLEARLVHVAAAKSKAVDRDEAESEGGFDDGDGDYDDDDDTDGGSSVASSRSGFHQQQGGFTRASFSRRYGHLLGDPELDALVTLNIAPGATARTRVGREFELTAAPSGEPLLRFYSHEARDFETFGLSSVADVREVDYTTDWATVMARAAGNRAALQELEQPLLWAVSPPAPSVVVATLPPYLPPEPQDEHAPPPTLFNQGTAAVSATSQIRYVMLELQCLLAEAEGAASYAFATRFAWGECVACVERARKTLRTVAAVVGEWCQLLPNADAMRRQRHCGPLVLRVQAACQKGVASVRLHRQSALNALLRRRSELLSAGTGAQVELTAVTEAAAKLNGVTFDWAG